MRQIETNLLRGRVGRPIARRLFLAAVIVLNLLQASGAAALQVIPAQSRQTSAGQARPLTGRAVAGAPVQGRTDSDTLDRVAYAAVGRPQAIQALPWTPPEHSYRLSIDADGMYRLDYAALSSAGLPVDSLDPGTFQVWTAGNEIAIQVTGDGDSHFEAGEALIFYGRSLDSLFYDGLVPTNKYTGTNIYWLTYGGSAGLRMEAADGSVSGDPAGPFPHRLHLELNAQYESAYPKQLDADHWFDFKLQALPNGVRNKDYPVDMPHVVTAAPDGLVRAALLGRQTGPHGLRMFVNGTKVFDQANLWSDFEPVIAQAPITSTLFTPGPNTIRVQIVNSRTNAVDIVYPNWLEVTYYDDYIASGDALAFENPTAGAWRYQVQNFSSAAIEVYDVTDQAAVRRFTSTTVTGGATPYQVSFGDTVASASRYVTVSANGWLAPSSIEPVMNRTSIYTPPSLLTADFGADYIVITHADFWSEALRLASHRARSFDRVAMVDVQRIYDQFNGGLMSAEAIHDFLAYAYTDWARPAPTFVVLMGDGTSDPRNYLGNSAPTFVPPYLYLADPTLGETAADNRFVTLAGDDILPDMHIGRLPVNTLAEAKDMVDKILAYELECRCDEWNYNTVFVTDNFYDGGGNFYYYSDLIADGYADPPTNTIPLIPKPTYQVEKLYLVDPNEPGGTCSQNLTAVPPVTECTDRLVSTLNGDGALFVSYVGHSDTQKWALEKLYSLEALPLLDNGPCLPVMLAMTCYEGSFQTPGTGFASLAEGSTRMPINGAIASISPTGFGLVTGHDHLERGLLISLLQEGENRLGAALTYAKEYLMDVAPQDADLVDTFLLIGDPALKPKTDQVCREPPTSVLIGDFQAQRNAREVQLSWLTTSEVDMVGFNLLRSEAIGGFSVINQELLPAQKAGSPNGSRYVYLDPSAMAGRIYWYKLQVIKSDGTAQDYGPVHAPATASTSRYFPLVGLP